MSTTKKDSSDHEPTPTKSVTHSAAPGHDASNAVKDPDQWATGAEPATGAQMSYLKTLSDEAGVTFDENEAVTKADASKRIDALRSENPRVKGE